MIAGWREWLYENGFFRPVELPAKVMSVGNISLGGTGKSPFVMYLCDWAAEQGISAAVLSRGYKRKHKKLEIVPPGAPLPEVARIGDEPWMIRHRHPEISLLVHADRAQMARRHWRALGSPRLILLDDGFQHWKAARDWDVLMIDAGEPLNQGVFPFGRLREGAEAVARADLVVITRASSLSPEALFALKSRLRGLAESPRLQAWKKSRASRPRVAAADYAFDGFFDRHGEPCAAPKEKKIVLAAGVAKPDGVRGLARSLSLPVVEEIYFPDHHSLSAGDLAGLRRSLEAHGDAALLLTEKDWARWREHLDMPAYFVRVKFRFLDNGEAEVREFLKEAGCSILP
jgi:tetraacyldisaccharide 4'-kinase